MLDIKYVEFGRSIYISVLSILLELATVLKTPIAAATWPLAARETCLRSLGFTARFKSVLRENGEHQ